MSVSLSSFSWRRGLALGAVALVASLLLGGGFGVERGYFWVLRSLWELGGLLLVFWLWRWWDAGRVLRLNEPPAGTPEDPAGVSP
jgi:hypothetical protein